MTCYIINYIMCRTSHCKTGCFHMTAAAKVEKLTTLAFGQRRKMIRQSLKSIAGLEEKCARLNIPLTARAEELTPQQFLALADEK